MKNTVHILRIVGLLSVLLALIIACGNGEQADAEGDDVAPAETETPDETDETATEDDGVVIIEMHTRGGNQYNDPLAVHVEPGTTVRWVQESGTHTVTAYHPDNGKELRIPEGAQSWDSGVIAGRGAEFELTLTEEGVYDYLCTLHEAQGHVGRIVVGDPDASAVQPADTLPGSAAERIVPVEQIVEQGRVPFDQ